MKKPNFEDILQAQREYYGNTEAAIEFSAAEFMEKTLDYIRQVKPILTVGIPLLSLQGYDDIYKKLKNQIKDYHIIVYNNIENKVKFEVFYEKDISEIELKELRKLVINSIPRLIYMNAKINFKE